jgi:hypothetical protein
VLPRADFKLWHQRCDVLQLEGQVWRPDGVGGAAAQGAGDRERQAQAAVGRSDAGQRGPEGRRWPKVVSPQARRDAVTHLMTSHQLGVTRACGLMGISRSLYRYTSTRPDDTVLTER